MLEGVDLPPFPGGDHRAGVDIVMTSHILYPFRIGPRDPATLSAPILGEVLRGRMGFGGVFSPTA